MRFILDSAKADTKEGMGILSLSLWVRLLFLPWCEILQHNDLICRELEILGVWWEGKEIFLLRAALLLLSGFKLLVSIGLGCYGEMEFG